MNLEEGGIDDLALLQSVLEGNSDAFNEVLFKHRDRLKRMVALRMNQKLQGRLDASDVIQDAFVEAARALPAYLENPKLSVFLWLRRLAGEKLIHAHRQHLDAKKRDVDRERPIYGGVPAATSQSIAIQLSGKFPSPSKVVQNQEAREQLMSALEQMDELDREVLTLKHFEHLSNQEAAEVLGIRYEAVKKRYIRALDKLQKILVDPTK